MPTGSSTNAPISPSTSPTSLPTLPSTSTLTHLTKMKPPGPDGRRPPSRAHVHQTSVDGMEPGKSSTTRSVTTIAAHPPAIGQTPASISPPATASQSTHQPPPLSRETTQNILAEIDQDADLQNYYTNHPNIPWPAWLLKPAAQHQLKEAAQAAFPVGSERPHKKGVHFPPKLEIDPTGSGSYDSTVGPSILKDTGPDAQKAERAIAQKICETAREHVKLILDSTTVGEKQERIQNFIKTLSPMISTADPGGKNHSALMEFGRNIALACTKPMGHDELVFIIDRQFQKLGDKAQAKSEKLLVKIGESDVQSDPILAGTYNPQQRVAFYAELARAAREGLKLADDTESTSSGYGSDPFPPPQTLCISHIF